MPSSSSLNLFLNGTMVGRLTRETPTRLTLAYGAEWCRSEDRLPVSLSLPVQAEPHRGPAVYAFFDNLLPEDYRIREKIAREVQADGTDAFSLLGKIGKDCVGALQFLPEGDDSPTPTTVTGDTLSETDIVELLNRLKLNPLGIRRNNRLRCSIAGAQAKTGLLFHRGQWLVPTGPTPTTHIIKPQIGDLGDGLDLYNSVENEYLCLKLLGNFGLQIPGLEMKSFGPHKVLVVERFDRDWLDENRLIRLPQEDCCQALAVPSHLKYQVDRGPGIVDILNLLRGSEQFEQDRVNFMKANILFWLTSAIDGHAKNFSIILLPGESFRLAPFYDVITVQHLVNARRIQRKKVKLAMRAGKRRRYQVYHLSGRDYYQTGVKAGMSDNAINQLFDEIRETADSALNRTAEEMPSDFPGEIVRSVGGALRDRLKYLTAERSRW